jgi:hypothetical protein
LVTVLSAGNRGKRNQGEDREEEVLHREAEGHIHLMGTGQG